VRMARMGLDMLATLADYATTNGVELTIRIGIHSGPVVAGVIGRNKFIYDLWGDTVNTASRMESHGLPSRVHVSEATVAALAGRFEIEARGEIDVKGKGPMATYFLVREPERTPEVAPAPTREAPGDGLAPTIARATTAAGAAPLTTWTVTLPRSAAVVASLTREGLGHKLKKIVKKELQTGDKAFDDAVFIATDTPEATAAFLATPEVRAAVAAIIGAGGAIAIDARRITIEVAGPGGDALEAHVGTVTRALVGA